MRLIFTLLIFCFGLTLMAQPKSLTTSNFEITYEVFSDCEDKEYVASEFVSYEERLELLMLHFEQMSQEFKAQEDFQKTIYEFLRKKSEFNEAFQVVDRFKIDYEILEACDGSRTGMTTTDFHEGYTLAHRMSFVLYYFEKEMRRKDFKKILQKFRPTTRA